MLSYRITVYYNPGESDSNELIGLLGISISQLKFLQKGRG